MKLRIMTISIKLKLLIKFGASELICVELRVSLQSVDWNDRMEPLWWNRNFSKNEAKRSHFLMHEDINSDLMASLAYTEVKCLS